MRSRGARPTEHRLESGEVELNYARLPAGGPAPTMLLLHGLGGRWQVFSPLLMGLRGTADLYALDFRGHGVSGRAPGRYRLADYVRDAEALLRTARPPVVVYGHSLGGWVALALAAAHPEAVGGIVVAESAVFPEGIAPDAAVSYLADLPIALRSLARSLNQMDPEVMEHFRDGRLTEGYDPAALLAAVSCPALLLQGDPARDALMTDEDVRRARALLTDPSHAYFEGLGHGLHAEDAHRVLEVVLPFLKGLEP